MGHGPRFPPFGTCLSPTGVVKRGYGLTEMIEDMRIVLGVPKRRTAKPSTTSVPLTLQRFATENNLVTVGRTDVIDWCNVSSSIFPAFYASIQSKYWHVSLFGYWQLRKLPCFIMAAPALLSALLTDNQLIRNTEIMNGFTSDDEATPCETPRDKEVAAIPQLWNPSDPSYKYRQNDDQWPRVVNNANVIHGSSFDEGSVKKQWKNLRDCFMRNHRALMTVPTGSGRAAVPQKWKFYDEMEFLLQSLDTEMRRANARPSSSHTSDSTQPSSSSDAPPSPVVTGSLSGGTRLFPKRSLERNDLTSALETLLEAFQKSREGGSQGSQRNAWTSLVESIANSMQNMERYEPEEAMLIKAQVTALTSTKEAEVLSRHMGTRAQEDRR
ncbi:hypothetical protein Q1695_005809 [Nippostrongylus brasiliensis]|nr:hypothetical protein Q1695_005809 [Nippostrongylus brasiliensis]